MASQMPDAKLEHQLLGRLGVGVVTADAAGTVRYLSPFASRLTGWSAEQAVGRTLDEVFKIVAPESVPPGGCQARRAGGVELPGSGSERATLITRSGSRCAIEYVVSPTTDADGRVDMLLVIFADVSQSALAAVQLARASTLDSLTGLLNHRAFAFAVERILREPGQGKGAMALLQVDLDQFNLVNNTCGHEAGNDLLQWVAALLREEIRESDVLARLTGDIFAVLLRAKDEEEARRQAESVRRRVQQFQFSWGDRSFTITASLGLVLLGGSPEGLRMAFSAVDHACARAKQLGRNQVYACRLEDEEVLQRERELDWVARIKANLAENRVALFAQPIRPLKSQAVPGLHFEVLMRLTANGSNPVSAAREIRMAEQFGLMGLVDRWVIRNTIAALGALPQRSLAGVQMCSINISAVSLHDRTILEHVHRELDRYRVPPGRLCFELTETSAVNNLAQARWLMSELLAIGCRMALDDFGSGLASFGYLKELPVTFLKIDGEFVENISAEPLNRAMVESIHQVARVFRLRTIAEAVAGPEGLAAVQDIGVDFAQGNHIGPPRPLMEVLSREQCDQFAGRK